MHTAPSVVYPVERSVWALRLILAIWVAGLASALLLLTSVHLSVAASSAVLAAALGAGALSACVWWKTPVGELHWDGADWHWRGLPIAIERVALDLQTVVLLHWQADGGEHGWLLTERRCCPSRWGDLRRAVYSRRVLPPAPPSSVDAAST